MKHRVVVVTLLVAGVVLAGCKHGRQVGTVLEPYCAADGSVVVYQTPNADGSYDEAEASAENCQ